MRNLSINEKIKKDESVWKLISKLNPHKPIWKNTKRYDNHILLSQNVSK